MPARRPDGAALLVAGHGASGADRAMDASAVHTLGQIGEALLATGDGWHIRRLMAGANDRYAADRATLKRSIDALVAEPVRALVVVLLGAIVDTGEGPALMTGSDARAYPEDATLPLSWIRRRLLAARAELVVVALSAGGDGTPDEWLAALGTGRTGHIVAIDAPGNGNPMVDALLTGLCGDAVDPRTGTVTMASLCEHVCERAAIVQRTSLPDTFAQPPPLAGLWDVRRSQLANRKRPPAEWGSEDLTGSVLPGRFRLDELVARGTFGTVYRARQLAVERDVAVKVLHADIDPSSEDGRLFVHEIRSVGRIDHTNVVRIHQADITPDGRLFFAMELLDGRDLQQVGADGPIPQARAIELVCQLLAGLGAAHAAGLVHADVKPANAIVLERNRAPRRNGKRAFDDVPTERHVDSAPGPTVAPISEPRAISANPPSPARATTPVEAESAGLGEVERVVLVDFGLARLRATDRPSESAGGTPAYMAPEQLHEGRVDARSDLYSAALVLVFLLTGWRRPNAITLVPPLDKIGDADLRRVLARALDKDPEKRFPTARELAAALTGTVAPALRESQPIQVAALPFRHLASLTEADRGLLYGRESDLAILTEHALYRRSVIYTAPSGVGKTSLLRAGLRPRLEALGVQSVYLRCRGNFAAALANAISPDEDSLERAIAAWHERSLGDDAGPRRAGKLVIILDQLETTLADADFVPSVLAFDRWPAGADVAVILSIREDFLARLVARTQELEPGMPIVRLPPLSPTGARAAITNPLAQSRLGIESELLDVLLDDLQKAAAAIGPEMGWGVQRVVFPPHLQLACSVLYEALAPGEATITLAQYRRLGGFDAIVGEHLERVIETELADGRDQIARGIFVALVTAHHERAMRPESELVEVAAAGHDAHEVSAVLEILRSRGLLVRVRTDSSEPGWELVHDSLIPRVLSWVDRRDLARRRAMELVRYHVRRSRAEAPSLLGRGELRELRDHATALPELDAEWNKRAAGDDAGGAWTPSRLVAHSRQVLRRRAAVLVAILAAAFAVACVSWYGRHVASRRAREQEERAEELERQREEDEARLASLRDRNLGRFVLSIEGFDWDPAEHRAKPVALPQVEWELRQPARDDVRASGPRFESTWVVRGTPRREGAAVVEHVEAHGGPAFLFVERGPCSPSIIPLRQLPGYAERSQPEPVYRITVPTCAATAAATISVPAGPFIHRGLGEPFPALVFQYGLDTMLHYVREDEVDLAAFAIDRTEVSNASFALFAAMSSYTGIEQPHYSVTAKTRDAEEPRKPAAMVDWYEARAYCRFFGKNLPSPEQWTKAMRGGLTLPDGTRNPHPRRNFPWGVTNKSVARIDADGPADVGSTAGDVSVYGVLDLGGNVIEWMRTESALTPEYRDTHGGNYIETTRDTMLDFMVIENPRYPLSRQNGLGFRCVVE